MPRHVGRHVLGVCADAVPNGSRRFVLLAGARQRAGCAGMRLDFQSVYLFADFFGAIPNRRVAFRRRRRRLERFARPRRKRRSMGIVKNGGPGFLPGRAGDFGFYVGGGICGGADNVLLSGKKKPAKSAPRPQSGAAFRNACAPA